MAPARLDPAPVAAPLEVTSPGGAAADRPSARRQLEARLAQVRFGSYHAVLDATEDTSARAMRDSFERLRAQFSPTRWAGQVGPDDIDLLDEIARGVEDAYSVLGDPELRARYERALATTARSGHPARAR